MRHGPSRHRHRVNPAPCSSLPPPSRPAGANTKYTDGFVGCMRALMVNGQLQNLKYLAERGSWVKIRHQHIYRGPCTASRWAVRASAPARPASTTAPVWRDTPTTAATAAGPPSRDPSAPTVSSGFMVLTADLIVEYGIVVIVGDCDGVSMCKLMVRGTEIYIVVELLLCQFCRWFPVLEKFILIF